MRILFSLRSINYDRLFEAVMRALLERGHELHVALDILKKGQQGDDSVFRALAAQYPGFSWDHLPPREDQAWADVGHHLRLAIDYMRYLEPEFTHADALRRRVRERTFAPFVRLLDTEAMREPGRRRALDRVLRGAEARLPVPAGLTEYIAEHSPDVVLVSPLVGLGSPQGDVIRAARALGIPTALLVASWDNLTNKGVIRDVPDATLVWNGAQVDEAVELHRLPAGTVIATGAHTYDQWFDWRPSTTREEFCARVGLDPERPYLLYVASSGFIAPVEAPFVANWITQLRESCHPNLREAGVLIRPHPANPQGWEAYGALLQPNTAVWPREGAAPTSEETKEDYFDSIHHASAVVGINTSALIESAIVGRPVFTITTDEFRSKQSGTLHFGHIAGDDGLLNVASSWPEHHDQLAHALNDDGAHAERIRRFLERFVRPHGLDVEATPRVVDAIETLATTRSGGAARSRPAALPVRAVNAPLRAAHLLARFVPAQRGRPPRRVRRGPRGEPLNVMFALDHPGLLMHFDETVRELARRGHRVQLAFGRPHKFAVALRALAGESSRIDVMPGSLPARKDAYAQVAREVRAVLDVSHYLDRAHAAARYSRIKWAANPNLPLSFKLMARRGPLPPRSQRALHRWFRALEEAIPTDPGVDRWLARASPDVVVISPLVQQDAYQTDFIKSARRLGIASVLAVASWDNLTSKGLIRATPDLITVWNDTQRREAVQLHRAPDDRIVTTGAQPFDRWFGREPASDPAEFRRALGLPPDKPYVLFVGSTRQREELDAEARYVRQWIEALRTSDDPAVADLAILVRPHPTGMKSWASFDVSDLGSVTVWQRDLPLPVLSDDRAAYFDSIYHAAAVVGINSSAMVEAAIVGRPVHTVLLPEWRAVQDDLVHFGYLLKPNGGFLRTSTSFQEHARKLAHDLRSDEPWKQDNEQFVRSFVRPHGIDRPALPVLVDTLERVGRVRVQPSPRARMSQRLMRVLLLLENQFVKRRHRLVAAIVGRGSQVSRQLPPPLAARFGLMARAARRGDGAGAQAAEPEVVAGAPPDG